MSMSDDFEKQLVKQANQLIDHLEAGDNQAAMEAIEKLYQGRDFGLFQEIGKLTRTVHDAIRNFHVETDGLERTAAAKKEDQGESSRIEDAKDRLEYVIRLTENAANKTMDMVEETVPVSKELRETAMNLKGDWERLMRRELSAEEFRSLYKQIDEFLDFAGTKATNIEDNLSSILLAQDYQDLTGQVIKKVIKLVHEVESSLVCLVTMASKVESITGIQYEPSSEAREEEYLEGPIINAEERDDVVASQDDVDDLLSSLGF
ncbi:MAG TPA: protein phosphatase [Gammaproteobacteria bacterium]|nr:protein phosphatase [Gammaproteobacteria bacterium]HBF09625.1 protein phosphatase [Gammaproteobacteria bacterium]HCK94184.1 protein phosphatase [Gammaproteobacteria bacterium]|tara:strand:- start:54408 stop:55193 length:786 start_codon:yes stop_codon:yes gene_type:complete